MKYIEFRGSLRSVDEIKEIWTDALDASMRDLPQATLDRVNATLDLCEQVLSEAGE